MFSHPNNSVLVSTPPHLGRSPRRGEMCRARDIFMTPLRRSGTFLSCAPTERRNSNPTQTINIWLLRSLANETLTERIDNSAGRQLNESTRIGYSGRNHKRVAFLFL